MIYTHDKSESFMSKFLNLIFKIIGAKNILGKKLQDIDNLKNEPADKEEAFKFLMNIANSKELLEKSNYNGGK